MAANSPTKRSNERSTDIEYSKVVQKNVQFFRKMGVLNIVDLTLVFHVCSFAA